ncbi:MAG: hypothetical protein NC131_10925 [Roseburia sp.]|nr:hypothetical protein [Roseburia sp.]
MEGKKVGRIWQDELVNMTRDLTEEVSKFKNIIFRSTISAVVVTDRDIDRLLAAFNNYLRFWEDYSNELTAGMQGCRTENADVRTINYDDIREFIYAKYDYASVLQFADGVFRGVRDQKFKTSEDVHDFFNHTVSKAFDDMDPSVAGILDTFLEPLRNGTDTVDNLGFNYFKTVRNNRKLFDSRIRTELYKATQKTIKYLMEHLDELKIDSSYNNTRLMIGSINKILEYAEIGAVVYASRIFIIGYYAYPFIEYKAQPSGAIKGEANTVMAESVAANYDEARYHIFRDADDAIMRGPGETKLLLDTFDKYIEDISPGIKSDTGRRYLSYKNPWTGNNTMEGNAFCGPMMSNPIFYRISTCSNNPFRVLRYADFENESELGELTEFLKREAYNQKQALSTTDTARESVLHIIRGTDAKKETVEEYKKLALDLHDCAVTLCYGMSSLLKDISEVQQKSLNTPMTSLPAANTGAECLRLLSYLYRDVTAALIQKARYIELKLNKLTAESEKKMFKDVSVRVPGGLEDEGININDNMMCAVPDTTRMPIDLIDLYALPTFEEMEMFDDFLRSQPYLEHDMYLTEAFNLSSLINAIISLIRGTFNQFKGFVNDKGVQGAIKWTTDNEQKLRAMNFNGKSMDVLPFKTDDSGAEKIDITDTAKNLIEKLNGFKEDDASSDEKVKAFVKSLYPSDDVYNIWAKQTDEKIAATSYKNFILYGTQGELVPDKVKYSANDLQKKAGEWVTTVKGANAALQAQGRLAIDLEKAMNAMKAKLVTMTNEANRQNAQTGNNDNAGSEQKDQNKPEGQNQNQNQQNDDNAQQVLLNTLLGDTQTAIRRLWNASSAIFKEYIMTEYGYIKQAYSIANH